MIETKEKQIGDSVYMVTQMPAMTAIGMQARLLKLIGPSFATLFAAGNQENPDGSLPLAISLLVEKLDEKTFQNLVIDLMRGVRKDGVELDKKKIDLDFAGNLNELFLIMQFVLEVNFSDFFQEGGIIGDLIKKSQTTVSPGLKKT